MSFTEALLIVIVIILTVIILRKRNLGPANEHTLDCIARGSGDMMQLNMKYDCKCPKCSNVEATAQKESLEYFTGCDPADVKRGMGVGSCDDGKFEYAVDDFGAPGMDYKDWVTSQAVDPAVLKNHSEFVKDRVDDTRGIVTGRTYDPGYRMGEMEGSDMVPWVGIRGRPQNVQICNPTQVPDYNDNSYSNGPKMTWKST
jgi:hypothetical protein